jgi:uncharacterized Fe-S center protein
MGQMTSDVYFLPLDQGVENDLLPLELGDGLGRLVDRLGPARLGTGSWGVKIQTGPGGRPAAIHPDWAGAVARRLAGGAFCFDTLSINPRGLDTPDGYLDIARTKGFGSGGDTLPFRVADDPALGRSRELSLTGEGQDVAFGLAAGVAAAGGLAVLVPVRPHPHLGFAGALAAAGLGLADRATKILLHKDIRPKVDTPLCAGCGSCLDVCLFDAIRIDAGRASIDHRKCTGCGECMNVCFMAGIEAEHADGVSVFQRRLAAAAAAGLSPFVGGGAPRALFFNFLLRLDRQATGPQNRKAKRVGDIGVLASGDPVALDRASWNLIGGRQDGGLAHWGGFALEPGTLLEEAEKLGLGRNSHRLVEV